MPIKVLIHGVSGRMGKQVLAALCAAPDMQPVAAVHRTAAAPTLPLPDGSGPIPLSSNLADLLLADLLDSTGPQVVVDFTNREACIAAGVSSLERGIPFVTGSTGLTQADLDQLGALAGQRGVGVIVAPNFALGAVLLMSLVRKAAPFFDYVDIIESHHEGKIDAPSGTALALARAASEAKQFTYPPPQLQTLEGTRGADHRGVGIHSLRQPGRSAHHEVVFGALGQTLTLKHDTLGRECYMPGVLRAVREVVNLKGLVLGLDTILGV